MRSMAIKMKSYVGQVGVMNHDLQSRLLGFLLLSFGFLAFAYIFLLGNMVFNIVERKAFEVEARTLANEVGALELSYLSMSSKVDLELSKSLGFKEVKATFATRRALGSLPATQIAKNEI
jgi:hypothetical protein